MSYFYAGAGPHGRSICGAACFAQYFQRGHSIAAAAASLMDNNHIISGRI